MCQATCPKCDGQKTISAFSHYASGICFACGGTGVIEITEQEQTAKQATADDTAKKRDWLLKVSEDKLAKLEWAKLHAAFSFAAACVACGDAEIAKVFPRIKRAFEAAV